MLETLERANGIAREHLRSKPEPQPADWIKAADNRNMEVDVPKHSESQHDQPGRKHGNRVCTTKYPMHKHGSLWLLTTSVATKITAQPGVLLAVYIMLKAILLKESPEYVPRVDALLSQTPDRRWCGNQQNRDGTGLASVSMRLFFEDD